LFRKMGGGGAILVFRPTTCWGKAPRATAPFEDKEKRKKKRNLFLPPVKNLGGRPAVFPSWARDVGWKDDDGGGSVGCREKVPRQIVQKTGERVAPRRGHRKHEGGVSTGGALL